jgi:aryl-alcohol dehydrogenase
LGYGIQTRAGSYALNGLRADSIQAATGGEVVGLAAVLGALVKRCAVFVVDEPHENHHKLALELGAAHVIDPVT